MPELDIQKMFKDAAAYDQEIMRGYTHLKSVRDLRADAQRYARNRKKKADWGKFASILSGAYYLLDLADEGQEEQLSTDLGIMHPGIMRDYMLGDCRPAPEKAARICSVLADVLLVKEADTFAQTARRIVFLKYQQKQAVKL